MKKKFVLSLFIIALCIVSLFAFVACNNNKVTTYKIAVPDGAPALAVTSLVKNGLSLGENEAMQLDIVNASTIANEVQGKKCDVAIMPTNAAYGLYVKSTQAGDTNPYIMVGTATYGNLFIVGKTDVSDFSNLKGKIIYSIGQNAVPHFVLKTIAESKGIVFNVITDTAQKDAEKLNVMFVGDGTAVIGALQSAADAYGVLGEPAVTIGTTKIGTTKKGLKNYFDMQELYQAATSSTTYGYPQAVVIAKKSFVQNNEQIVKAILKTIKEGETWLAKAENQQQVTSILTSNSFGTKSATTFPASSIAKCNVKILAVANAKTDCETLLKKCFNTATINQGFFSELSI